MHDHGQGIGLGLAHFGTLHVLNPLAQRVGGERDVGKEVKGFGLPVPQAQA